jgi:anti-sigma regulatory factor (Ser/Thr protein kinase)
MNVTAAYAVEDPSQISGTRRAALDLAAQIEFSEERAGQVALIVSELATNLAKHAKGGQLLVRPIRNDGGARFADGIEILAIDRGPGMRSATEAREDGYSTTGTLGHGLGSIERLSDFFQLFSESSGTVALSRVWRERPVATPRKPLYEIGAVMVSHPSEDICGDDWGWTMRDDRFAIMLADGLGHGLPAHEAAAAALEVFHRVHEHTPSRVISDVHSSLRGTRGAAVAMLAVDTERGVANYCGVGNIGGALIPRSGNRQGLVSQNGTAGYGASRIQEFSYPVPAQSILIMYSDGLASQWDLSPYPGLQTRHPSVIAGVLYRDFSRRRDDVTVVVAKSR